MPSTPRKKSKPASTSHVLKLTRDELIHVRDLFSVLIHPSQTVSQALAVANKITESELVLWKKVLTACQEAKIPLGTTAPDFIVAVADVPVLGVFPAKIDRGPKK